MRNACPIAKETVDEWTARLCAILSLVPLGLSVWLLSPWPALFLAVDFALRGLGARRVSPVARLAKSLARLLRIEPRGMNAGPKAFAAKLGCGFSLVVGLSFLFGMHSVGLASAVPFGLCAILEGAFGYCVGCRMYRIWQRLRPSAEPSRVRS